MTENNTNPLEGMSEELQNLLATDKLPLKPVPVNNGLREDQQKALAALNEWAYRAYKSRGPDNFFALRGSAGTGKTTLIATFLKELKFPYRASRVCISAPTHKAKKVLQAKTGWRNSETTQALLGLKMDVSLENFDPNNPEFEPQGETKMRDYEFIAIDEASMINSLLFNRIVELAIQCGTKILFIGDPKQLNPVKEMHISPALISPINSYELTQIIRQEAGNPLIQILDALRDDIEHGTANYIHLLKGNPTNVNANGEGYIVCDAPGIAGHMKTMMGGNEFREDKNFCRYISWTNQSITDTNKWIRQNIVGTVTGRETLPDGKTKVISTINPTLEAGEILLAYRTVIDGDDLILTNSDDYEVSKVEEIIIDRYDIPIHVHKARLVGIDTGAVSNVHIVTRNQENYENFAALYKQQVEKAKKVGGRRGWGKFYEFKNDLLVIDMLFEGNNLLVKKDLDYGYGITIHKSQGSTYNTVFVNGKDINKNMTDVERKRLWYVALSRASKIVYINL